MKRIILFIAIITFTCGSSFGQDAKFVVLTVKGSVTLERNRKSTKIKAGEKIYDNDNVKIGKKSYLDLVYKDGKTIEVKSVGVYSTTKLIKIVNSSRSTTTKKFANFVLAEFAKSVDDINNMKVTGSVERLIKPAIDYASPFNTNILDQVVTFKWYSIPSKSYVFTITNSSGEVIYSQNISDTLINLNLQQKKLSQGNNYKWFVLDAKRPKAITDTCRFFWLSKKASKSIKDTINILMRDWKNYDKSIKQALLASFYYNHKLYIDMLQAYERAIKLSPDNLTYKKLYILGLEKVGLKRTAEELNKKLSK